MARRYIRGVSKRKPTISGKDPEIREVDAINLTVVVEALMSEMPAAPRNGHEAIVSINNCKYVTVYMQPIKEYHTFVYVDQKLTQTMYTAFSALLVGVGEAIMEHFNAQT